MFYIATNLATLNEVKTNGFDSLVPIDLMQNMRTVWPGKMVNPHTSAADRKTINLKINQPHRIVITFGNFSFESRWECVTGNVI
jgi:hypothetical protein